MRVILTGGGTYGHVSPLEPIAEELRAQDPDTQILFIGMKGDRFGQLIKAGEHVDDVKYIYSGKYRRYPDEPAIKRLFDLKTHLLNVRDVMYIFMGTLQSYFILKRFKPDVVFGKGGHVSVPVGIVAGRLGVGLIVHESDSKLGIANRILLKRARTLCIGMPKVRGIPEGFLGKVVHTGTPVRSAFARAKLTPPKLLREQLQLTKDRRIVVISGGSQGAASINQAIYKALPELLQQLEVVHIVGDAHVREGERVAAQLGKQADFYHCIGFTDRLAEYFAAADVVVTRASATSFAELAYLGKPVILVPAAHLSDQIQNANNILATQAAVVIQESQMSELPSALLRLLSSSTQRTALTKRIARYANEHAARDIARLLLENAKEGS